MRRRRGTLWVAGVVLLFVLPSCSFLDPETRPTPGAWRNLICRLEYRPAPEGTSSEKPDILFLAAARPYKSERFHQSPPDAFWHAIFAPGRHLTEPLRVAGANCEGTWQRGKRLPQLFRLRGSLACRRKGLEPVVFEATTKYGHCRVEIPAGQGSAACQTYPGAGGFSLDEDTVRELLGQPCWAGSREPIKSIP